MPQNLGSKIKELRKKKVLTLKDLSKRTGFSTGFLSQLERGLTTIAIDSLANIAKELDVDLSFFIPQKASSESPVVRSYERKLLQVLDNRFIHHSMEGSTKDLNLLPRMIEILPPFENDSEELEVYQHDGEEFIYILEGTLSLKLGNETKMLSPGDSAHYKSSTPHNWENRTNRSVKIIVVHTPNYNSK